MNTFHAARLAIIALAHEQTPALTSARLLEQIRQEEALAALRAHWQDAPDPFDLGGMPPVAP